MKTNTIAYWLIPAGAKHELFAELIHILAKQLDAPRFEPHLTICITREDARSVRATMKQITAAPIRLRVRDVDCSNHFTRTLFVRFQRNRALDHLNTSLCRTARMPGKILRSPHLSLLYRQIPIQAAKQLAATIKFAFDEVLFDSIKAVRCASPTTNPGDVEAWRVVATKSLANTVFE